MGLVAYPVARGNGGDTGVYTDRRKRPLEVVSGHLCTLLRRELHRVARVPQPPWCVGGAPSVAASPLVGKTGSARAPQLGWRLRRGSNPHKPPRELTTHPRGAIFRSYSNPRDLLGRPGSLSRPLRAPLQATSDRSSQQPRPGASRGPSGRGGRPASCAWSVRGSSACPAPSSALPSRPFHHGAETACHLLICHILPCFTPVREATPTHPSA